MRLPFLIFVTKSLYNDFLNYAKGVKVAIEGAG
jgi:hypothetical protein